MLGEAYCIVMQGDLEGATDHMEVLSGLVEEQSRPPAHLFLCAMYAKVKSGDAAYQEVQAYLNEALNNHMRMALKGTLR